MNNLLSNSKTRTQYFLLLCASALASIVMLSACGKEEKVETKESSEPETTQVFKVPVVVAETSTRFDQLEIPGIVTALPDHSVKVSPAMAGKIVSISVVPGSHASKNEVIATLDDTHLRDLLEQSKTAVDTANVALKQARNSLDFANENVQRQKKLFDAEVSAKKDIVVAENQVISAQSQIETAKSQLRTAQTVVKQNETELAFTKVHCPIAGIVANRFLNVGDTVDPNTPILQVIDLNKVIVNAQVTVESAHSVSLGDAAIVSTSGQNKEENFQATAVITAISPSVDVATNTIKVQLECTNKDQSLKDGEQVIVVVKGKKAHSIIVLPKTSLVPDPEDPKKQMVYVVENKQAHRVSVIEQQIANDKVEILSGLRAGQKVIARDAYGLPEKSTVEEAGTLK